MSSIETQIVQLFDLKTQIINQLKHHKLLYDQHLASKLLIQGISPPPWLLPSNSHLTALNKEGLISGLLYPRPGPVTSFPGDHGFLYDKPVLAANDSVADEASDGNRLSSNGCDEDVSSAIPVCHVHDTEDGVGIVAPSHVDISACALNYFPMSPDDHSNTRTCNTQPNQEQSLVRIHRSRSRQKALVVRNSADASSKSRLGITNNVDSLSQNSSFQGDEHRPRESLEWVRSLSLSTEICHKDEASLNVRSYDASNKEVEEVHIGDNRKKRKNSRVFVGRNTRSSSQCRLGITNEVCDFSQNRSCQGDEPLNGPRESLEWVRSLSLSTEVCHKEEASINLRSLDVSGCLSTKFAKNEVKEVQTGDNRQKKKSSSVFVGRNTRSSSQCQQSKDVSFESGTRGYFTQPDGSREMIESDQAFALPKEICFEEKEGIKICSAEGSGDVRSISLSRDLTLNNNSGGRSAKKSCQGYEQVNGFRESRGLFMPLSLPSKICFKKEGIRTRSRNRSWQGDAQLNGPSESLGWVRSLSLPTEICHEEEASINAGSLDVSGCLSTKLANNEVKEVHTGDNQNIKKSRSQCQQSKDVSFESGTRRYNTHHDGSRGLPINDEVFALNAEICFEEKQGTKTCFTERSGDGRSNSLSRDLMGNNKSSGDHSENKSCKGYKQVNRSKESIESFNPFSLPNNNEVCFKEEGIRTCSPERSGDAHNLSVLRVLTMNKDGVRPLANKSCHGDEQVDGFRESLELVKPFLASTELCHRKETSIEVRSPDPCAYSLTLIQSDNNEAVEELKVDNWETEKRVTVGAGRISRSSGFCQQSEIVSSVSKRQGYSEKFDGLKEYLESHRDFAMPTEVFSCEEARTRTYPTGKSTDACHISLSKDLEINKDVAASSGKNNTQDHELLNGLRESIELAKPFSLPTETCNKEEAFIEVTDPCFGTRETVESRKVFASPRTICLLQEAGVESCSTKRSSGACDISLSKSADIEAEEGQMGNNGKKEKNSSAYEGRITRSRSHSEQFMDAPSSSKTHGSSEQFDGSREICGSYMSSGLPIEICSWKEAEVGPCLTKGSCDDTDISLTTSADSKANDEQTRHDGKQGKTNIVSSDRITTSRNGCQSPSHIRSSRQTSENEEYFSDIRESVELVNQTALPMGNFSQEKTETGNRKPETQHQEDSGVDAINTMTCEHEQIKASTLSNDSQSIIVETSHFSSKQLEVKTVLVSPVMSGGVINLANGQDVIDSNSAGHMIAKSKAFDCEKSQQPGKKLKFSIVSPVIERTDADEVDQAMPEFERFGPPSFGDELVYNEIPNLSTPVSPFPASCKFYLEPGIYSSVPGGLLENFGLRSNIWPSGSALQRKSHSDLFSFPQNQRGMASRKPFLSPIGKVVESITSKSGGSEVKSGNPELTCFTIMEDPESSEEDVNEGKTVLEETDSSSKSNSIREPLSDITCKNKASLVPDNAMQKRSSESINTDFSVTEICNVDSRFNAMSHRRSRRTTKGKENKSLSVVGNSFKKNSKALSNRFSKPKLSGQSSLRIREQSMSDMEPKRNNIVSNVKSFVPLVQQKQAAAAAPVKRDVKVKALEAAEAAKRLAEKKENERKLKKEALKTERARLELENLKQMELAKKLKEEAKKKRGAENAAKKRQKEEDEKKERERKRKRVEDARFQQKQAEEKIQAWREKERTLEGKELNMNAQKESDKAFVASISSKPVNDLVDKGSAKTEADGIPTFNDHKIIEPSDIGKVDSIVTAESSTPNINRSANQISRTSEEEPYDISPYQGSDGEEDDDEIPNKKHIPSWTSKSSVLLAVSSQQHLDPDTIFPPGSFCSMDEVLVPRRLPQNSRK